ncbi:chromosome segregation protein SMC [Micavibrio aeruginosavorus]|uniref:Chromosome partition protein Smc n=1 Tax=Micavibrio aeruginosavorus EPB TaxID=349215 RepID=M4VFK6_9BACT|nr:chromosome segregation protein SMC [Micavibrio aeruginosavorus]AGH97968.1 Chromosome partition protein smc [Micavibrio aeruginosavorus EPB]
MVHFKRVRMNGFKSFVEKTDVDIVQGLTGVVGPNGCGKSNLVEAIRWSMGETSSKRMRGGSGSMEDVIFNGTANRPRRSFAEVTVILDNSDRSAPPQYAECDEIEVVRRIERDHGSSYKINGKPVRARDVQLLYADMMSGASSPFLISQGKMTQMITAKPAERRVLLEEAAGITGLYARRHEAELRLRATDNNLKRVEDVLGGMDTRLNSLKKQARQASKYRTLATQIRQLEVMIATLDYRNAYSQLREIERVYGEAESLVAERLLVVTGLTETQNSQSQDLPDLRMKDAEFAASLQTQKLALQRLEDEEQRLSNEIRESKAQLDQAQLDHAHETTTLTENTTIIERLDAEEATLKADHENEGAKLQEKEAQKDARDAEVSRLEEKLQTLTEQFADVRARRQSLENQINADRNRLEQLRDRLARVETQLAEKQETLRAGDQATPLREALEILEKTAETLRAAMQSLESNLTESRSKLDTTRETFQQKQREKGKLDAEIATLTEIVEAYAEGNFKPVLEDISADEGFETALSKALGDALMASLDESAPVVWKIRNVTDLPALPAGMSALEPHIKAPAAVKLALSQIGVVESEDEGHAISQQLKPGQALVSRDGAYWRWDGLYMKATAADRHAIQLKQKNRLAELVVMVAPLEAELAAAKIAFEEVQAKVETLQTERRETQNTLQSTDQDIRIKRSELNRAIESQSALQAELAKLEEALSQARIDSEALEQRVAENASELDTFDEVAMAAQQEEIETLRAELVTARESMHDAIRELEQVRQEHARRASRLQAIEYERTSLQNRCARATERLAELSEREQTLTQKIESLQQRPGEIRDIKERLLSRIAEIESEKSVISDQLAAAESDLNDTNKALKSAENDLTEAKERRAHAQATVAARQQQIETIIQQIRDQFDMTPEELSTQAEIDPENPPVLEQMRHEREKAVRDRDMIGPVNLRADVEAEELETELGTMLKERDDLAQAIDELRSAINTLNKEARERLNTAFNQVNTYFQQMFTRLFGGGSAHLSLIEADDPLQAGLEIFAQPPGKVLQSLTLLSGGEQTLTATALIFAIFMTNPSPICVLDEVDAPLDDANVDRFCDVLTEFAAKGETRFILITHHRLTMARMDRLYGVTMAERGVSQLVSVDLNKQLDFLDEAA